MSNQAIISEFRTIVIRRLTILAMFCVMFILGQAKSNRVDSLSARMTNIETQLNTEQHNIEILQKEMAICEKSLERLNEHVDRTNEEISNQISSSSHTIQVWGWIMTVLAFVFGFYINRMWRKIADATANAKEQLRLSESASDDIADEQQRVNAQQQEVKKIQEDTETKLKELQTLHSNIQNNMSAIYEKMKREETKALLTHLVNIPEDIYNISTILLSRVLEKEDFPLLFQAYHNLITRTSSLYDNATLVQLRQNFENYRKCENEYLTLFAQHFMKEVVETPELRELVQPIFKELFAESFFMNDAEKSTKDFKKGVSTLEILLQTDLIKDYILAMSLSKYSKFTEWYKILLSNLSEAQLEEIWYGVTKDNANAVYFAQTIKDIVATINPKNALLDVIAAYMSPQDNVEEKSE